MSKKNGKEARKIVIKRFEVVEGGHHGGSWKIAYADFVTAMMAFFLVMWIINATTEEQRKGIANFFNPMAMQKDTPPPLGSVLPPDPAPLATSPPPSIIATRDKSGGDPRYDDIGPRKRSGQDPERSAQVVVLHDNQLRPGEIPRSGPESAQQAGFRTGSGMYQDGVVRQIRSAITDDKGLSAVKSQVAVTSGDDGIHIQIADSEHEPMFHLGSALPNPYAIKLLQKIVPYLDKIPGQLSIAGYTDAAPYRPGLPGNWALSTERAVSARDILVQAGFPDWRLKSVSGHADRELFDAAKPLSPKNRRIILILSPEIISNPPG